MLTILSPTKSRIVKDEVDISKASAKAATFSGKYVLRY